MFSPMMSSSWSVLPTIMVNSTPFFFTSATFVCGFWNNFYYFKSTQETCATVYYLPLFSSSKYLNALARLMYQSRLFQHGLIRPIDFISRLKIFLKKVSLPQLLFERSESKNNKKKLLLVHDDDGTNSRIKTPAATDNRTFGLVTDDDYPDNRVECRTLTIYNNNNNHNSENNVDNNFKGNDQHLLHS
mmetsp:Transcript_3715/g.4124  ORF Transcript_3715/g.4124 Transcript_3715/m.4124 type:complete len:188 (+) Transcript_3715:158-721(+)